MSSTEEYEEPYRSDSIVENVPGIEVARVLDDHGRDSAFYLQSWLAFVHTLISQSSDPVVAVQEESRPLWSF